MAVQAHRETNCVTELLLPDAEAWVRSEVNLKGPLAGVPISLKDSIQVKGFDASVGYAKNVGKPAKDDGPMVKLFKDAGQWLSFNSLITTLTWFGMQEPSHTQKRHCP